MDSMSPGPRPDVYSMPAEAAVQQHNNPRVLPPPWSTLVNSLPSQVNASIQAHHGRPVQVHGDGDDGQEQDQERPIDAAQLRHNQNELKLSLVNVSLQLPPHLVVETESSSAMLREMDRSSPVWSTRIAPVLASLQSFVALAMSLSVSGPVRLGSDHAAMLLQSQVTLQQQLTDSLLGTLFAAAPCTIFTNGIHGLDLLLAPQAIRKAAAHVAASPVPVPLANIWSQHLVYDAKEALQVVAAVAEMDYVKLGRVLRDMEVCGRQSDHAPTVNGHHAVTLPSHEREPLVTDVALAAEEPVAPCPPAEDVGAANHPLELVHDCTVPVVQPDLGTTLCDSPRPTTPHAIHNTRDTGPPRRDSDTPQPSPEGLSAILQAYAHLRTTCLSALGRLSALQPPPSVRADLEAEIYRARLEHVLWNMYLGQSGGMFAAALTASKQDPPAPVLNVMPTLNRAAAIPTRPGGMRSRIPVPVRHVVISSPAPRHHDKRGRPARHQAGTDSVLYCTEEDVPSESEYASGFESDCGEDEAEMNGSDHECQEPEPPRSKVIRGGGGSTSLKLPKSSSSVTPRQRANTLDTVPTMPTGISTITRKSRPTTRAPMIQPPWSITAPRRPRSTSTNASTSTFGGAPPGRVRPRVSSFRGTHRSPSPLLRVPPARPPQAHHSPTSPTTRTLTRPASTPSLLAAMAMSHSTPALVTTPPAPTPLGGPGFFPPFIPAGNLGLGDADVAKQRVYNRLSSWHLTGRDAEKVAERQAVYEERFRAAAMATVAVHRMAASGVKGKGKEGGVVAAMSPSAEQQAAAHEQSHDEAQVMDGPQGHDAKDDGSRTVSPTPSVTATDAVGKVKTLVLQMEQVGLGGDHVRHGHEKEHEGGGAGHASD